MHIIDNGRSFRIYYTPAEQIELRVVASQNWTTFYDKALRYLIACGFDVEKAIRFIMRGTHRHIVGKRSAHKLCWKLAKRSERTA